MEPYTYTCSGTICSFASLVDVVLGIINAAIPVLFGLVVVVVVWKVADTWILNAADMQKRESGRQFVIAGIVALVVMSALWGIVAILQNSLFGG